MDEATEERLRLYPRALLGALAAAFVLSLVFTGTEAGGGGRLGGDFPAFLSAGRILVDGDAAELYSWARQGEAEVGWFPEEQSGDFLPFAYPPFVALAYAPLALLPYRVAYALHTVFMAGCVVVTVRVLVPSLPRIGRHGDALLAFAIGFHPVFRSVFGGQNSTLSTLLFVASGALVATRRPFLGGVVAGLLMFKPQLAVPLWGLWLLERNPRIMAGIAASAAGLFLAGVLVLGPSWPWIWWVEGVSDFQANDRGTNGANGVGFLGFAEVMLGVGHPVAVGFTVVATLATVALLCWAWATGTEVDRTERIALAAVGALLISPHAMFYDAALVVPALLVALDRDPRVAAAVAGAWVVSQLDLLKGVLGFTPVFFVTLAALGLAFHAVLGRRARAST